MDLLRDIKSRLVLLDHQGVINLASIQRWVVMVVIAFSSILYLWDKLIMEDDPTAHFPPGLVPLELRRKMPAGGFTSEDEARAFAIRDIDFAVITCLEKNADPEKNAMDTIVMMKSAALLSKAVIHFHIFTDDALYPIFMRELDKWPSYVLHRVSFHFSHVTYPELFRGWRDAHVSCSSLKLFLPHVLKGATHVLYVNSDALFLGAVENLWKSLLDYNEGQVASFLPAPAEKSGKISKLFPVRSTGINSDIVLYDIYRLRHSTFEIPIGMRDDCVNCESLRDRFVVRNMTWNPNMLHTVYNLFSSVISVPHRDIFDIIYYFNPGKFHLLPCSWGFRWEYCDAILSRVRSKFLNAVLHEGFNETDESTCESTHLVHGDDGAVSQREFDVLKALWSEATYKNAGNDMVEGLGKTLEDVDAGAPSSLGSRPECERMNLKFFLKSLKQHQGRNYNEP